MATITGQVLIQIKLTEQRTAGLIAAIANPVPFNRLINIANGVAAGQLDELYGQLLPLAISTPQAIDLSSFPDVANVAGVVAARCRILIVENQAAPGSGANLTVGAAPSNPWAGFLNAAGTVTLPPGGILILLDPYSAGAGVGGVTSPTSHVLQLDPGAHALNAAVVLGCTSAA